MKFYLRTPVFEPQRFVSDYTPEELARFRDEFHPLAKKIRRHQAIGQIVGACFFVCFLLSLILKEKIPAWLVLWTITGLILTMPVFVVLGFLSAPCCPACHNSIYRRFGPYCPQCGARALEKRTWFRSPRCSACGQAMRQGKNNQPYKIRACTSCGVKLDGKGL